MNKSKIITDYSHLSDDALDTAASAGIKGTTGNAAFKFIGNELTNATTAQTNYHTALAGVATGNSASVTLKNTARTVLVDALSVLCAQINIQAAGDLAKLQTTGFVLAKTPEHQMMGDVINFQVKRGANAGSMELSVDKPPYADHGTEFAYWDPTLGAAPTDINQWFQRHSNGHSISLTGLQAGKTYPFAAAYKGADADALLWSAVISKMVAD